MKNIKSYTGWFTLIEILLGVTIVSMVTISWLYAVNAVGIGRIKLMEKTKLEQQAFYFSERFFEIVKSGGTLDYEEYFQRKNIWNSTYLSGHYDTLTSFGNGANSLVHCISWNTSLMWNDGCILTHNDAGASILGDKFLYGQYPEQFIDYNSDADGDGGDEDGDGSILGDDDDLYLGNGPSVFWVDGEISEIYLIGKSWDSRTFFRWYVQEDPNKIASAICDFSNPRTPTGDGCFGTIQFLRLKGVDWWNDHSSSIIDVTQNDGIIDTWIYDPEVYGTSSPIVADLTPAVDTDDSENYWLTILGDNVNVKNIKISAYPNKDSNLAWADNLDSTFLSPYLRISMTILPSWKERLRLKGSVPEVQINTTINLTTKYN